jgi:hypothetical protein
MQGVVYQQPIREGSDIQLRARTCLPLNQRVFDALPGRDDSRIGVASVRKAKGDRVVFESR